MNLSARRLPSSLRRAGLAALAIAALLGGCATQGPATAPAPAAGSFELAIAHINDHHSQLDAGSAELVLDGVPTQVELGGFARQTALFKSLVGTPNLLKLHAGDAMTGSLYYTFFKGRADARMMNTICFDAFVPGNHEFDDGDATLKAFLDELAQGPCQTPTLSANIVPAPGTPLAPAGGKPYLQPMLIKEIGGVRVGLVGITIADKTRASSRPLASTQFLDETKSAQAAIDALTAQGVRHIVLMTHHGFDADQAMVSRLRGVDVVIGGDSHTLLGDFKAQGLASGGRYPTVIRNADGDTVCVGQAWEYAKAFGLMKVTFDAEGRVSRCDGQAALVIGDTFKRKDATGAWQPLAPAEGEALKTRLATQPAVRVVAERDERAHVAVGHQPHVATVAAVATVRTTEGHRPLTAERHAAGTAVATTHVQLGDIDELAHSDPSRLPPSPAPSSATFCAPVMPHRRRWPPTSGAQMRWTGRVGRRRIPWRR